MATKDSSPLQAVDLAELLLKYSTKVGAAGNANTGNAAGSLGKYISTTQWAGGVANDLFDDVSGAENTALTVDYRCLFFHNSDPSQSVTDLRIWISAEVALGTSIALAVDSVAASALANASAQALEIATETTAPAGPLTFSSPVNDAAGLVLGTIAAGQVKAFWVRRTAANNAALAADGFTLGWAYDTAA